MSDWIHPTKYVLDESTSNGFDSQKRRFYSTGLVLNNSMTSGKIDFVPINWKRVNWYACGPTVYDSAHLGHARNYVSFDIIRRVLEEYFGYDVNLVMNITDIDDKIINRSKEQNRENYLDLAREFEAEFFEDMKRLNVKLPDVVTRVSEFVPEIIEFISKIISRKYAYESEGSVYFDVEAFRNSNKHVYGRMEPNSVATASNTLEGEDEVGIHSKEKRSPLDFALWKKVKGDEPSWESPWGRGRPGWHIECSVMASHTLGFPIDIHSGGIDLRFPHHDNELAQTEAYYDKVQWVNYFLHSGHLHIHGSKMSKSLKNFTTIRDILKVYSPRQTRMLFLLHKWDTPMNYSPETSFQEAIAVDKIFINFFANVRARLRNCSFGSSFRNDEDGEKLRIEIENSIKLVDEYLCDNVNTPEVIQTLKQLVSQANTYMNSKTDNQLVRTLLNRCAKFVYRILFIFGLCNDRDRLSYGEDFQSNDGAIEDLAGNYIEIIGGLRGHVKGESKRLLSAAKKERKANPKTGDKSDKDFVDEVLDSSFSLLSICDQVRDKQLPKLNIVLEDGPDGTFVWKSIPSCDNPQN
ncbi:cysteinyl-tRNA synthetase [Cryptosporidium bovis]|uniref:cysteinyl-tRNA synthetase n=1 Tax=Cryptosporidium bovis TaxID=310047 RepID=UPI00351A83FB|nr:cysteinyl-tRNA synthetase [Cryptosporidium bovis]